MAARNPKKLDPAMACRGRHSKCGGKNPAKSATWHLCEADTVLYRAMKKAEAAKAGPKVATPKTPKSAGSSQKTTGVSAARVPKNSGGQVRASQPPTPMHVPVALVNAPEQAPHIVQLVAPIAAE